MTDNVPFLDAKTTIIVSPFYGEYDICPKVKSTNFLHVDISKLSIRLCSENAYLLSCVMCPPDLKVRRGPCSGGRLWVPTSSLRKQTSRHRCSLARDSEKSPLSQVPRSVLSH